MFKVLVDLKTAKSELIEKAFCDDNPNPYDL